jgi:Na+/proline symporter
MQNIDWIILIITLLFIVIYGTLKTKGSKDYILGNNEVSWWTIGLSVMATQASAITFLSTPGQAYHDGMGFIQFYFGLPIAMIIICITFIPIYHKLKVYTAYEFLEQRFDLKLRWSVVAFGGIGKAIEKNQSFSDAKNVYSVGTGFRYLIARAFKIRTGIDIAKGPDSFGWYIVFGHNWNR